MGIITAIIGAVRIGGPAWLRAIVGRANENLTAAEVELTTSTSSNACELWNGQTVERLPGAPKMIELIYFSERQGKGETKQKDKLFTVVTAKEEGLLWVDEDERKQWGSSFIGPRSPNRPKSTTQKRHSRLPPDEESQQLKASKALNSQTITMPAPNISLNLGPARQKWELRLFALGVLLQAGVIVFSGFAAYNIQLNRTFGGKKCLPYGYPLTAVGTVVLVAGMLICSFVVESSTRETL